MRVYEFYHGLDPPNCSDVAIELGRRTRRELIAAPRAPTVGALGCHRLPQSSGSRCVTSRAFYAPPNSCSHSAGFCRILQSVCAPGTRSPDQHCNPALHAPSHRWAPWGPAPLLRSASYAPSALEPARPRDNHMQEHACLSLSDHAPVQCSGKALESDAEREDAANGVGAAVHRLVIGRQRPEGQGHRARD